jgi:Domain of unknown function (DUF4113)/Peptidase S24-like
MWVVRLGLHCRVKKIDDFPRIHKQLLDAYRPCYLTLMISCIIHALSRYRGSKAFKQPDVPTENATGFSAAADDYMERGIDLNEHLVRNKPATYFMRVSGNNMMNACIHDGDIIIVDRSVKPVKMIDNVNFSMRNDVLKFAGPGTKRDWKIRQELRSKRFTTRWEELIEVK